MRLSILELRHSAFATVHSLDCSGVSDTSSPSSVCTLPGSPALKVLSAFAGTYISSSLGIHTHEPASKAAILARQERLLLALDAHASPPKACTADA